MNQPEPLCNIPEKQNSERSLKHIAAWSHLYGHAKVVAGWQFILSVPCALAMSLVALRWPEAKVVTTPISLLFGWIDVLGLERIQSQRKKTAAIGRGPSSVAASQDQWYSAFFGTSFRNFFRLLG